jgi:hypothetical protein
VTFPDFITSARRELIESEADFPVSKIVLYSDAVAAREIVVSRDSGRLTLSLLGGHLCVVFY